MKNAITLPPESLRIATLPQKYTSLAYDVIPRGYKTGSLDYRDAEEWEEYHPDFVNHLCLFNETNS
jgi:hypothetical protein